MTNRVLWLICRKLIDIARRKAVPSPDISEILHYAMCGHCRSDFEAQGWHVEFKHEKKEIYEVTFRATETLHITETQHIQSDFEDEEAEDEEEKFEVRRPKRPEALYVV